MNAKVLFAAIALTFVLAGAAMTASAVMVQPAIAGPDDGGSGTGGGSGGQNP